MQDQTVFSFPDGSRTEIRSGFQSWKGVKNFYIWRFDYDGTGNMRPSGHGIVLPVEMLPELEKAVGELKDAARG